MLARGRTVVVQLVAIASALAACTASHAPTGRSGSFSATRSSLAPISASSSRATGRDYRAELMSRPLHLPSVRPGQSCPASGGSPINAGGFGGVAQGVGPVHPLGANTEGIADLTSTTQYPGWLSFKSLWFSEPRYQGPFLVRVRAIDGATPVGMLDDPGVTSFYVPSGPTINGSDGYREQPGATWVRRPSCIAWQVDGLTFSHVIIVRAVCRLPDCTQH